MRGGLTLRVGNNLAWLTLQASLIDPIMLPPTEPPINRPTPSTAASASGRARFQDSALVQNKFAVLAVLFFVTGFLGLPLLWICKSFSTTERWFWAILNTLYTCTLIWIVFKICVWSWNQISQSLY